MRFAMQINMLELGMHIVMGTGEICARREMKSQKQIWTTRESVKCIFVVGKSWKGFHFADEKTGKGLKSSQSASATAWVPAMLQIPSATYVSPGTITHNTPLQWHVSLKTLLRLFIFNIWCSFMLARLVNGWSFDVISDEVEANINRWKAKKFLFSQQKLRTFVERQCRWWGRREKLLFRQQWKLFKFNFCHIKLIKKKRSEVGETFGNFPALSVSLAFRLCQLHLLLKTFFRHRKLRFFIIRQSEHEMNQ